MSQTSTIRAAAGAIGALALLLGGAAAAAQRFGETAEVVAIEIPVQVVRDGEPVRGLTAADFEVFDGRKKQAVTGFEVIDLAAAPAAAAGANPAGSAAARRHFLLLFDLSFSEPKSIVRARESARQVVETALHPSDLVAVATYSSAQGPQLVLGFTSDRRQVAAAIDTLGLPKLIDRASDPLRLVIKDMEGEARAEAAGDRPTGATDILEVVKLLETTASRADLIGRVNAFSRSMADLAKLMGGIEGRKYVLFLSEGFDSSAATGTSDQEEIQDINRAAETDPTSINTDVRYGNSRTVNVLERMYEEFRRADCAIQTVDIGGLRTDADTSEARRNTGKETLLTLAKSTGGELFENFNDPKVAMGQMLRRTSVTYVLTIEPGDLKLDGDYHRIKVELKGQPRGTRVVHRPGFYAPKPFAEQSPLERLLDAANTIVGGADSGTVLAAVLAAPFRAGTAADNRAYVPVLIEVDGPSLLAGFPGDVLPAEIYVYAIEKSGAVEDFLTQNMGLDLGKAGPALRQRGLKFFGHLDLPPGSYSVRVLVRNARTGAHALRVVDLEVPAFEQAGPVLLPPLFPEPAGRWLMTREAAQPDDRQVPFPFLLRQEPFLPASRPVLSAGQEAQVSLVAYNLGAGDVQAEAAVLGADGKEAGRGPLTLVDRERGGASGPDRLTATFRAPALAPGEYTLQVTLIVPASGAGTDAASGVRRTSSLPFVISAKGSAGSR